MKLKVILHIEKKVKKEIEIIDKTFILDLEKMKLDLFFNMNTLYKDGIRHEIYDQKTGFKLKENGAIEGREMLKILQKEEKFEFSDVWSKYLEEMENFGYADLDINEKEFDRTIEWTAKIEKKITRGKSKKTIEIEKKNMGGDLGMIY